MRSRMQPKERDSDDIGLYMAFSSQSSPKQVLYPLYAPCIPPVCPLYADPILNTLATGLSVAWRTLAAPERVQWRWLTDLERMAGRALPWRAGYRLGGQFRSGGGRDQCAENGR